MPLVLFFEVILGPDLPFSLCGWQLYGLQVAMFPKHPRSMQGWQVFMFFCRLKPWACYSTQRTGKWSHGCCGSTGI